MKTRFFTSIAIMLFCFTAATAGVTDALKPTLPTLAKKFLEKRISYPAQAENAQITGTVVIELRVMKNKQLEIVTLASDDECLTESVEKQLRNLESKLTEMIEPGKSQQFKLTFQMEQ